MTRAPPGVFERDVTSDDWAATHAVRINENKNAEKDLIAYSSNS
jgi:hypothetical protein